MKVKSKPKIRDYMRGECAVCGSMPVHSFDLHPCVIGGVRADVCDCGDCGEKLEETLRSKGIIG